MRAGPGGLIPRGNASEDRRMTSKPESPRTDAATAPAQPQREPDRAEKAGFPPDYGPEQPVLSVRKSWIRCRPLGFVTAIVLALAGISGMVYFHWMASGQKWLFWPATILAFGSLGTLVWWWISRFTSSLEITNKRAVLRRGLLSKSTSEVLHDNIRNVTVEQSFWERVFKVGSLGIASSGQDGIEILCTNLPDPEKIRKIIDLYRPLD